MLRSPLQPHASLPGVLDYFGARPLDGYGRVQHPRPQVEPGRLRQELPDEAISRFRYPARPDLLAARVLRREQADVGLERPGVGETAEVAYLDCEGERGVGGDPLHAREPRYHRGPSLAPGLLFDELLDAVPAVRVRADLRQVLVEDRLVQLGVEAQTPQPVLVGAGPRLLSLLVDVTFADEEVGEPELGGGERLPSVLPHADEVFRRLLLRIGYRHFGNVAGGEHPREQEGVASVVLDPVARRAEHLGRRADDAFEPGGVELAGQGEPGRSRLVHGSDRPLEPGGPADYVLGDGLAERALRDFPGDVVERAGRD